MQTETYTARMQRVQQQMRRQGVDLFLVSPSSNLFYLTGYAARGDERLLVLALPDRGQPLLLANRLYEQQVAPLPVPEQAYWDDGEDPYARLAGELRAYGWSCDCVALEEEMTARFSLRIARALPAARFMPGETLTGPLRLYKDDEELAAIRHACRMADAALGELLDRGRTWLGKTEREFERALAAALERRGVQGGFAIVAVGANAALPHHATGETPIADGQCLLIDFGGTYQGYYTDMTRTVFFGQPDEEFRRIYHIVLEAHHQAEAAAQPGAPLEAVDRAARAHIEASGYGERFTHRTGHGLGLDVHEGPSAVCGEKTPLAPRMVLSNEPGIYLPGRFGVRIENLLAITSHGPQALHQFPRELLVL